MLIVFLNVDYLVKVLSFFLRPIACKLS